MGGWNNGYHLQYHPLGAVHVLARAEHLHHLTALEGIGLALLRCLVAGTVAQLVRELVEVELGEQVIDSLSTHLSDKLVRIAIVKIAIALGQLLLDGKIFFLAQEFILLQTVNLITLLSALGNAGLHVESSSLLINHHITWIDNDVTLVVDYRVELLGG